MYSRYRSVRYRIRREIGYNAMLPVCMCVCVSVENRLEREIFQSQVPRTKRYPVYKPTNLIWAVNHKRHLDIEEEDKFRMVFVQVCISYTIGYTTTNWVV